MLEYKSNLNAFKRFLGSATNSTLKDMGKTGKNNIRKETPVQTGNLRSENGYEIEGITLYFYNTADYAPYVELGTHKQSANPFMRRGIQGSISSFTKILTNNLSV